jgi:excisionase family DNA binding protein
MADQQSKNYAKVQEPLLTIPEAAAQIGVPASALRRAVNAGHIPTHSVFNARKRVRISELLTAITEQEHR